VPQHVRLGRHRGRGHGRYFGTAPHHSPRTNRHLGFSITVTSLVVANVVLGGLVAYRTPSGDVPTASVPLPTIAIPAPSTGNPPTRAPERAQRQRAKPRPPVLLGPASLTLSLTAFCQATVSDTTVATPTGDGWTCDGSIDMDAACRWLYDDNAWAGMLDDNDQQTWRCYQDPS
jgi:hypothetical protein